MTDTAAVELQACPICGGRTRVDEWGHTICRETGAQVDD